MRRVVSVFLVMVMASSLCFAQNRTLIDSLLKKVDLTQQSYEQFELLNTLGWEYRFAKPDSTIFYCNKAYQLGNKNRPC